MIRIFLRYTLFLVFSIVGVSASYAQKTKTIYAFTYGTCFNDSVTYLSGVQVVTDAQLEKKTAFLNNRMQYSNQLKHYLDSKYGGSHTCAILFGTKKEKLEKKYAKIRRSVQKTSIGKLVELPINEFQLTPVSETDENN